MSSRGQTNLLSRLSIWVWLLGLVLLCPSAFLAGAQQKGTPSAQLVWPPPPDEPRITFVQSIVKPSDAGTKVSGFRRFTNWLSGAHEGDQPLNRPFGLALDETDNLCITDPGTNAVCFFDRAAKRGYRWEQVGDIHFGSPVAVAKKGKTIFVADSDLDAVIAFNTDGKLLFQITDEVTRASGLAIAGDRLLVADAGGHCVAIFDLRGKFLSRFGGRGADTGQFNFPTHVAADSRGNIYVTDSMNSRVQVFDAKGHFERQIGAPGDSPGSFGRPKGVAVDASGRVYVADAMFDNFQIFDSDGRLLLGIGHQGSAPGEFWLPNGIAVGHDNLIYVADTYNGRIQLFKPIDKK